MNGKDIRWTEKWSKDNRPRMYPHFYVPGYGSDYESATSLWMATLLDPLGDKFKEGVRIHDYGCGCARLFNFMTGWLENFTYFGSEPSGSIEIILANRFFGRDPRAKFMSCEEAVKSDDAMSVDAIILGSVFTHLLPETCEEILKNILPVADKGGMIIFTALLKPKAEAHRPGAHGFENCYGVSFQAESWIGELEDKFGCGVDHVDDYETGHGVTHKVYRIMRP